MKQQYINKLKCLTIEFCGANYFGWNKKSIAREMDVIESVLNEKFGMDWDEIEEIGIEFFKLCK